MPAMTINFPNEIWAEICAYLPPDNELSMIGLNRYFFEVAMDKIYGTVCMSDIDDREQTKVLQQLRHPQVASRVQHLQLCPCFLPLTDHRGKETQSMTFKTTNFLEQSLKSLCNCARLEKLTIQFHFFRAATPQFHDFLHTLLSTVAPTLRSLVITTSVVHLGLMAAVSSCAPLLSLDTLNLTILPSYFADSEGIVRYIELPPDIAQCFQEHAHSLLNSIQPSLRSLYITNHDLFDLSPVFKGLADFLSLETLEYQSCSSVESLSDATSFCDFVKTSTSLSRLSMRVSVHALWSDGPPRHYVESVSHFDNLIQHLFRLHLSCLREFLIQLLQYSNISIDLPTFSPNLRRLTVDSIPLEHYHFKQLLSDISKFSKRQSNGRHLEHLEFLQLKYFSPEHMDMMARSLPGLKVLGIGYEILSLEPHRCQLPTPRPSVTYAAGLHQAFRSHVYPSSRLKEVYLQRVSIGKQGAPKELLDSLSEALPNVLFIQGFPP
ncbi:hypothetical protein P691DRAFT_766342 [Macrolepiota fuliginosa MF-IS2]|uniref:F-box domain-containing protein n=1 Tax=Macrolepiota fuliginosa MF-IS2 TaxID=1400762 RepID=A0A9P5X1X2_9AGAR|nr:hypothetical protein P691DRAFT_766342 [Macrolepiota fuliginosa MF-IS2]